MDALEALMGRRSIRRYTAENIATAMIETILKAAMSAPSANDEQPWHFVVINERAILDRIPEFHKHAQMLKQAPLAILVCGDRKLAVNQGYMIQDCSAATENLLIAAHALGLGAVWLGLYPWEQRMKPLAELLNLPEDVIPIALISVGHPAEKKPPANRYRPERIRWNHW